MRSVQYILFTCLLVILLLLIILVGYDIVIYLFPKNRPLTWNLPVYQWTGIGVVAFFVLACVFNKNLNWFATFSHELTHTVVSILLFRKIHSFQAGRGTGEISTSGNSNTLVFVDLAPYCLPVFTYFLLALRMMMLKDMLMYYDVLVGLSIGFHAYCFKSQTGSYQSDINKHPLYFSYLYIATALLFNVSVILVSYWKGKNVFTAFWYVLTQMWERAISLI
jgi:hypothetical protein